MIKCFLMNKLSNYFYIFSKLTTSFILFLLIFFLGYALYNSYQDIDKNNPRSLTLFEKKIKSLCSEIKDKTLAKYFLESFMGRINELTPFINLKKNNISKFNKITNPLQKTKEIYKHRNKFDEKSLKEFSILFLVMNNLDIFRKKIFRFRRH